MKPTAPHEGQELRRTVSGWCRGAAGRAWPTGRGLTGALSEAMAPTRDAAAIKASMASGSRIRPSTEGGARGRGAVSKLATRPVGLIGASRQRTALRACGGSRRAEDSSNVPWQEASSGPARAPPPPRECGGRARQRTGPGQRVAKAPAPSSPSSPRGRIACSRTSTPWSAARPSGSRSTSWNLAASIRASTSRS